MSSGYSDLQVANGSSPGYSTLEYHNDETTKQAAYFDSHNIPDESPQLQTVRRKRICGLTPRTFWIFAVLVAIVVIAGAVGGGVGGGLSHKSTSTAAAADTGSSQSISTSTSYAPMATTATSSTGPITSASSSTVALTTTQVIGPSTTLLSDCPSSNNTLYNVELGSTDMSFRKICGHSYLSANNGFNVVSIPTASLDDCIDLCAEYNIQNQTEIASGTSSICNAVCWRATIDGDDYPGQCFGFTTQNSSSTFVITDDSRCNSAALINQQF